ncbi:hypothetical protein [Stakelama pacifica]|uniref:Uncharacterized protein n=1 Tax=Stakelama pacifica TaxID=517720 RepID=A0A4R6FJW4_9SPHN|nr:hypothetical protein [Stakelama pacifica]TDN81752.1 hypothetical protein EV664_107154 [Stakelama pacifica]GGO96469.1 hypothetical protein GCM10011329_23070 [Stakelama pacifica]
MKYLRILIARRALARMVQANRARIQSPEYKARSAAAHKGWATKRRAGA